jgi:aryl-phospho-beta-D-glucosidase BglC (GH1 family)
MNRKVTSSLIVFTLLVTVSLVSCEEGKLSSSPVSDSSETSGSLTSTSDSTSDLKKNQLTEEDFLSTKNTSFITKGNEQVSLRGTNVGNLYVQESWMATVTSSCLLNTMNVLTSNYGKTKAYELMDTYSDAYWNESDFINCANLGMNVLRLPISYIDVYDVDFSLLVKSDLTASEFNSMSFTVREDHLKKIDSFIKTAGEYGIYTILDLHGAFGSQNGNDHSVDCLNGDRLWQDSDLGKAFQEKTTDLWTLLATRYKDNYNVAGYDVLNEPAGDTTNGVTTSTQYTYFDELYQAIRKVDSSHVIFFESCWDGYHLPVPSKYGWTNICYEFHHYEWSNQDDDAYQYNSLVKAMTNILARNFNVPIYLGEFRLFTSTDSKNTWKKALSFLNEKNINWTTWTYQVKKGSNWGIYNFGDYEDAIINSTDDCDTYETIKTKWSSMRNDLTLNEVLSSAISETLLN